MLFDVKHYKVPNRYPWTKDFIKAMWQGFWTADKQLRNKTIRLVKVKWQGRSTEETSWEREDEV